jgi:L-asparaginase
MDTYQYSGGTILDGSVYVPRHHDTEVSNLLLSGRHLVTVTAPRQSGKSSLIEQLRRQAHGDGHVTAVIDMRIAVGTPDDRDRRAVDFFYALFLAFAEDLKINRKAVIEWHTANRENALAQQVFDFFTVFARRFHTQPLLIGIDEIDWVSLHGYHTDDLFEGLRLLAVKRDEIDMSLIVAGINHPTGLLKSIPPSTFNISTDVFLRDFGTDDATVAAWSAGLPWDEDARRSVGRTVLEQTGGQPFLTSVLFHDVREADARTPADVEAVANTLIAAAQAGQGLVAHFQAPMDVILANESRAWQALTLYQQCLSEPVAIRAAVPAVLAVLRMSGLVRERGGLIEVKSPIYRGVFDSRWVADVQGRIGTAKSQVRRRKDVTSSICVINTGGMISMELMPDGRIDEPQNIREFFRDFPEMREIADVDPMALMCKDSTNILPTDWRLIAEAIYQRRNHGYKGFVVAHGTDTLAYTASAVAFALGPGLDFPVVFTAAQVPRHVLHGDARANLLRACTIATMNIPEVVVSISDYVYRAVRVEKKDDYRFEAFHSPTLPPLATIAGEVELATHLIRKPDESRGLECRAQFEEGIFKLSFYPGLDPAFLIPVLDNSALKGLIIETPGIGVVPTDGRHSLLPLIQEATARAIPVLLVSQYPIQKQMSDAYTLANKPVQAGAILAGMSTPAAVAKFMWVLPQVDQRIASGDVLASDKLTEVKRYMDRNIIGELIVR